MTKERNTWNVSVSQFAKKTFNPIRNIIENLKIEPHPSRPMIALSIGDPTVFGNLSPAKEVVDAVVESVRSGKHNGYIASTGAPAAQAAVAEYMSFPNAPVEPKDVIICSGCSSSLDLCIGALGDPGTNILVPRPGFPLYTTLAAGIGVESKYYNLLPEKNWQIDLDDLESQIDSKTVAIIMNNPSNPCGSVFSRQHLEDLAAIAVRHKVPVIADEIYDHFVFSGEEYHPIASVNPELPVLACGGLTKRFLVPGWRTGWIAIHDRGGVLTEVAKGLKMLSQRTIGSNTIVQGALPTILKNTPQSFFDDTLKQVQANAMMSYNALRKVPGLTPTLPQGAMYMMVRIHIEKFPEFLSDLPFLEKLVSEQSVFCLPGACFEIPNFFRVVLTVPEEKMIEACARMAAFCADHYVEDKQNANDNSTVNTTECCNSTVNTNESCTTNAENGIKKCHRFLKRQSSLAKRAKLEGDEKRSNSFEEESDEDETGWLPPTLKDSNYKNGSTPTNDSNGILNVNGLDKSENGFHSSEDKDQFQRAANEMKRKVAEVQTAVKKCIISSVDDLVDEMEHD